MGEGARRIPTPVREGPRRITTPVGGGGGDGGGRRMTNPVDNHVRRMISSGGKIKIKTFNGEGGYFFVRHMILKEWIFKLYTYTFW